MNILFLECIGFSGTHSITSILKDMEGTDVSHGSQNFLKKTPIGIDNQTPIEFVNQLIMSPADHKIAVHTNMNPNETIPLCNQRGIDYKLLVREPIRQINSCYKWVFNKAVSGDVGVFNLIKHYADNIFPSLSLPANLQNILFLYAVGHIVEYNLAAISHNVEIIKMEEILSNGQKFEDLFKVPNVKNHKHFSGEKVSIANHSSHIPETLLPDIADNEIFMKVLSVLKFDHCGEKINFEEYKSLIGY